jgi:hypothetical protein
MVSGWARHSQPLRFRFNPLVKQAEGLLADMCSGAEGSRWGVENHLQRLVRHGVQEGRYQKSLKGRCSDILVQPHKLQNLGAHHDHPCAVEIRELYVQIFAVCDVHGGPPRVRLLKLEAKCLLVVKP